MSLFTKLFAAVHSWRRRRGGIMPRKRSDLSMEQLDHRQLLAVNFTGVVANDFPATGGNGVQVVTLPNQINNPNGNPFTTNQIPVIPPTPPGFRDIVNVSGKEIDQYRVLYTAADDTLNIGLEGPFNGRDGREVIAGDSDNNGNSATVDPRVTAVLPQFMDPADMGFTKQYGVFLDLKNPNVPDIVAGFANAPTPGNGSKPYEVAAASNFPAKPGFPPSPPLFDQANQFPQYTGNYYLANDPNHPNFELQIAHFSQLYQQITGQALTPQSNVSIGAFGQSTQDGGISDEYFPPQPLNVAAITQPVVPPIVVPCPPVSPPIFVNPHQNYHVNSAHPSAVRVSVLGSSGFDPTTIVPSSVRFGDPATIGTTGATPILNFENNINHDQFPDETFVFNGLNVNLPAGVTQAEIIGTTTAGTTFASTVKVFNRDVSYYTQAQINSQQAAWARYDKAHGIDTTNGLVPPPPVIPNVAQQRATSAAINDLYHPFVGRRAPLQVGPSGSTAAATVSAASFDPVAAPTGTVKIRTKAPARGHRAKAAPVAAQTVTVSSATASQGLAGGA